MISVLLSVRDGAVRCARRWPEGRDTVAHEGFNPAILKSGHDTHQGWPIDQGLAAPSRRRAAQG